MTSDHESEIRASVAAHQDLGSGYDDAVAEGLVERIGAEIDKRVDARLAAWRAGGGAAAGGAGPRGTARIPGVPGISGPGAAARLPAGPTARPARPRCGPP